MQAAQAIKARRMFERSRIADGRLRQLKKSYRDYHEKKMHRDRALKLDRNLWGPDR